MMTAGGQYRGSKTRNPYLFRMRQQGTLCCSPRRLPPEKHLPVDVGQPGGKVYNGAVGGCYQRNVLWRMPPMQIGQGVGTSTGLGVPTSQRLLCGLCSQIALSITTIIDSGSTLLGGGNRE